MKIPYYTTVEELLLNESFLNWYYQTNENDVRMWNEWIGKIPKHQQLAIEAVLFLMFIRFSQESKITPEEIRLEIVRLRDKIRYI